MNDYETERLLVSSTAHVTEEEARALEQADVTKGEAQLLLRVSAFNSRETGKAVVKARELFGDDLDPIEPSAGYLAIHAVAAALDCRYILFDRDGPEVPGVPTYDW